MILTEPAPVQQLDEDGLRAEIARWSVHRRYVDTVLAQYAARLSDLTRQAALHAGRSEKAATFEAQREAQQLTGMSRRETAGLIEVGGLIAEPAARPWLASIGDATRRQEVSVEKARIIQSGIGEPTEEVKPEDLGLAVEHLAEVAPDLSPEQLEAHTRAMREELDARFILDEERRIHEARSAKFIRRRDGSSTLFVNFDKQATPVVGEFFDNVIGPRTGAPRFVAESEYERAIKADPRTDLQLAHDALVSILRAGLSSDPHRVPGRAPAVRILVTEHDLRQRAGYGVLEDGTPVTLPMVDAALCEGGYVEIGVTPHGKPLSHGRDKRFFTDAQRTALAIRDGGCRNPRCDRPPNWTEAHHIDEWVAHTGATDLERGILLCKRDHLDLHNRGARIEYGPDRDMYVCVEADGTRTDWPSKSRILARLRVGVAWGVPGVAEDAVGGGSAVGAERGRGARLECAGVDVG